MGGGIASHMHATDLNDAELLQLLAICAHDVYTFSGEYLADKLTLEYNEIEDGANENEIQFGVYTIKSTSTDKAGQKIMAFRGRNTLKTTRQLRDFASGGQYIRSVLEIACSMTQKHGVQWVCGHSLGGAFAECVCSKHGIGGAAFNTWGPYSSSQPYSLLLGNAFTGVPFEVHLTSADPMMQYWNDRHISAPKWHHHMGEGISEDSAAKMSRIRSQINQESPPEDLDNALNSEDGKELYKIHSMDEMVKQFVQ
mmetsp:Transcript_25543/g.37730  ORF Transcript_25543/g.37730 Transcript_25543/m.37730 type:complete len:254 (+) Transcript_25543:116-877(+)|eukprot:CAMPEP_0185025798 /NCGR_PEP_ID=MMETSP1103-20130426/9376_1 /TAXON_ID=36769 /ORGANISM="Paraphysomonas bandaiensis, Strain Caron Lab Isolate" /LENGTH=253 /DNA_ID=CAMNT_0027559153 /DNA_START=70 /DNA_END=831 /DNA_ORIENTATION=+